jgi:hypothetical protein
LEAEGTAHERQKSKGKIRKDINAMTHFKWGGGDEGEDNEKRKMKN